MEKHTNPLISIVIPLYNTERFIGESIESILAQTVDDFELIVIDDCSTDTSAKIVEEFMARDPRIVLLHNERNLGAALSRNRGIDAARGRFIAFMDADDCCVPDRFEKQLAFFEANPQIDICGSYYLLFENDRGGETSTCGQLPTSPDEIRLSIFFLDPLGMSTVMLRSEPFKRTGIRFRPCATEDYRLWADLSDRLRMANIPECLIHYRRWDAQISVRRREQLLADALEVQTELLDRRLKIRLSEEEARIYSHFTLRPEELSAQEMSFFRRLLLRIYRACRQRESYPKKWLKRSLLNQYLFYCRRFYPAWRIRTEKYLFRLGLLFR